jgi:predicted SAM-dependent methyltransferase
MKASFNSRWANNIARAGITLGGLALFFAIRPDLLGYASNQLGGVYHKKVVSPKVIENYFREHSVRKLQIGAGLSNRLDWLNTDIEPSARQAFMDATQPFPFPDASFQYVMGEQVIEHVSYEAALGMLKEAHRVLAPGGKIRIATPNLLQYIALFGQQNDTMKAYIPRKLDYHYWKPSPDVECFLLNAELRSWGHQFVYTPKMLRASFEKAGFTNIKQYAPGESEDPAMAGLEMRSDGEYKDMDKYESMVFEAVR